MMISVLVDIFYLPNFGSFSKTRVFKHPRLIASTRQPSKCRARRLLLLLLSVLTVPDSRTGPEHTHVPSFKFLGRQGPSKNLLEGELYRTRQEWIRLLNHPAVTSDSRHGPGASASLEVNR